MAFTAKLGTSESTLPNIAVGQGSQLAGTAARSNLGTCIARLGRIILGATESASTLACLNVSSELFEAELACMELGEGGTTTAVAELCTSELGTSVTVLGDCLRLGAQGFEPPPSLEQSVSQPIDTLTDSVGVGTVLNRSPSNFLANLGDQADVRGPIIVAEEDLIELDDVATRGQEYAVAATDAFVSSDSARSNANQRDVEDTLTLLDFADNKVKARDAENTIDTVDDAANVDLVKVVKDTIPITDEAVEGIVRLQVSDTLSMSDRASYPVEIEVVDLLSLQDDTDQNIKKIGAADQLSLSDSVVCGCPIRESVTDELIVTTTEYDPTIFEFVTTTTGLADQADAVHSISQHQASDLLQLTDQLDHVHCKVGAISLSADDTLSVNDDVVLSETPDAADVIPISDDLSVDRCRPAADTLSCEDEVTVVIDRVVSADDTIPITHSLAFCVLKGTTECDYTPFVGGSSDPNAPTPPPGTLPALPGLPPGVRFRLQFPVDTPTEIVDLRAPDFGNRDRLTFTRINRETRGGTLLIFADPKWPQVQSLAFQFSGLKDTEAQALLTFMRENIGQEIAILDHEGRKWRGVITTPDEAVVQDSRNRFSANFEFEGQVA